MFTLNGPLVNLMLTVAHAGFWGKNKPPKMTTTSPKLNYGATAFEVRVW